MHKPRAPLPISTHSFATAVFAACVPRYTASCGIITSCVAHAGSVKQTACSKYLFRCIRDMELVAKPATRVYAAGAPQPIVAADARQLGTSQSLPNARLNSSVVAPMHLFQSHTSRCEYSLRCIRELHLSARPATRCYAAGSPQPIVAADARQLGTSQFFSNARLNSVVVLLRVLDGNLHRQKSARIQVYFCGRWFAVLVLSAPRARLKVLWCRYALRVRCA